MQTLRIFIFVLLLISVVKANGVNEKRMILINNISGNLRNDCLTPDFHYEIWAGYRYYTDFDTTRYSNQTIGFIINDLSTQFELLESITYSDNEKFKPEHYFIRTSFSFLFKMDDTTALEIQGCLIDKNGIIKEENDSLALEHMLKQESFELEAVLLNVKERYNQLKNNYLRDSSLIAKESMQYYENYFPEACK